MMSDRPRYELTKPESPKITRLVPFERHISAVRRQFFRGVLVGILGFCAVAIPAFKYWRVQQHGISSQPGLGQTALGTSGAQAASGGQKASETSRISLPSTSLSKPQPAKLSHFADSAEQPALTSDRAKSQASFAASQPAPLTDPPFPQPQPTKKTLATLAQLWASFEAGNTKAAVALADLYLRGDGVPVNCEQARVLLFVASKENDAQATKELQELDQNGCPAR
jgi:TPR repeat protein